MKKFVIVSDSCCDLDKSFRDMFDIEYIPMHYSCDGKEYDADLDWGNISVNDFYQLMRDGKRIITAQITALEYKDAFVKHIENGFDVLYVACSSGLSNSVKTSYMVRDELLKEYPDSKIICVDSLNSCPALGLLCIRASELRQEGKSIEEVAEWVTSHRKNVHQECTVEKLTYLKQAGRVSAASAFFGGILSVKPIIISDVNGYNSAVEKVKGRKVSIQRLVERFLEEYQQMEGQRIIVAHADCLQEAEELKARVMEVMPDKDVPVHLGNIGPIVGGSAGPGTISVCFFGKTVEFDSKKQ